YDTPPSVLLFRVFALPVSPLLPPPPPKPTRFPYTTLFRSLLADAAEDPRNLMTERSEDDDRHDRDQGEQERVLDERLTLLTLPQGRKRRRPNSSHSQRS